MTTTTAWGLGAHVKRREQLNKGENPQGVRNMSKRHSEMVQQMSFNVQTTGENDTPMTHGKQENSDPKMEAQLKKWPRKM